MMRRRTESRQSQVWTTSFGVIGLRFGGEKPIMIKITINGYAAEVCFGWQCPFYKNEKEGTF